MQGLNLEWKKIVIIANEWILFSERFKLIYTEIDKHLCWKESHGNHKKKNNNPTIERGKSSMKEIKRLNNCLTLVKMVFVYYTKNLSFLLSQDVQ